MNATVLAGAALVALLGTTHAGLAAQPLAVAKVEYRDVDTTYSTEAVVEAVRQSTISAQVMGRIVELRVDVDDSVKVGQVVARIDEREAAQVLASSEAQVAQARANLHVVNPQGAASFRQVRLGEAVDVGLIEVLAGIAPGEPVAMEPIKAGMARPAAQPPGS